jgi:hypothetical protein
MGLWIAERVRPEIESKKRAFPSLRLDRFFLRARLKASVPPVPTVFGRGSGGTALLRALRSPLTQSKNYTGYPYSAIGELSTVNYQNCL